jgi:hypothetical protein
MSGMPVLEAAALGRFSTAIQALRRKLIWASGGRIPL